MMREPRRPSRLSQSLHRQLNSYARAASAAGVGLLALTPPSEARIVYTKAHVVLPARNIEGFPLDMNHGGVIHFTFFHEYSLGTTGFFNSMVQMIPHNPYIDRIVGKGHASALPAGARIGPGDRFSGSASDAKLALAYNYHVGRSQTHFLGAWANNGKGLRNRYVGLRFTIKGKVHYGWARVSVSKFYFTAVLTGYAYETIPGKSIKAGQTFDILPPTPDSLSPDDPGPGASLTNPIPDNSQPASLGLLALGAPGLAVWRREDSVDAKP
jgi:hypothetical protein